VKFQVGPTVLLLSSRVDDLEHATHEDGEEETDRPYQALMRVASEFTYEHGRRKLAALRFGEEHGPEIIAPVDLHDVTSQGRSREKLLKLSSWIDMNCKVSVGCAGAVLAYLQRRKFGDEGSHGEELQFQCVEMFSLMDAMWVSLGVLE